MERSLEMDISPSDSGGFNFEPLPGCFGGGMGEIRCALRSNCSRVTFPIVDVLR